MPAYVSADKTKILWDKFSASETEKSGITKVMRKTHPRIFTHDWNEIKAKIKTDIHMQHWYDAVIAAADKLAEAAPTKYYVNFRNNINDCSTEFKYNVIPVAAAYCLTGDVRYKNRVWSELENVGNWPNWGSNAYLCTAHILFSFALCYDWLYHDFAPEEREKIVGWMRDKGFNEAILAYEGAIDGWWAHGENNWNNVCNGSNLVASLAFADELPEIAEYVTKKAAEGLPYSFGELSADGSYAEPVGYWGYAISHQVKAMSALQTSLADGCALPDCLNFEAVSGLDNTCDFPIYYNGTVGAFNYGDGASEMITVPCMLWLADFYNKPQYAWYVTEFMDDCGWNEDCSAKNAALSLLWYNPAQLRQKDVSLPLDKFYTSTRKYGANGISMRSAWTQDALVVLAHAGDGSAAHGNLDAGGFVLDWMNKRWVHLYGRTPAGLEAGVLYSWPNYHLREEKDARFMYYHVRGEANNTIIANPQKDMPDMYYQYYAQLTASASENESAYGVIDMTSTNKDFESAKRTISLADKRSRVVIRDEIAAKKPSDFYWFANTTAEITLAEDKKSTVLRMGEDEMLVRIVNGPETAVLEVVDTVPLPTSPNPPQQPVIPENKLRICVKNTEKLDLCVEFVPQYK